MGRTPPGRSRIGWIAVVALLALLAALAGTCEPAAEVREPGGSAPDPGSERPAPGRKPRERARRDGGQAEGADGATGEAPAAGPDARTDTPPPEPTSPQAQVAVRPVSGRVVDSSNDQPVAGARVLLAVFAEGAAIPHSNWGSRTGPDGRFEVGPKEEETHAGGRVEVIVLSPAHHLARAPAGPEVVVHVELRRTPEVLGSLVGTVIDGTGAALPGVRQLSCTDLAGDWKGLWSLVGDDGSFRVEGVAPGPWSVGAGEGQPRVECLVPAGGESRVTLVVARDDRPHAKLTDEELQARLRSGKTDADLVFLQGGTDAQREFAERVEHERSSLRWEELARRTVRAVAVDGLPADATVVRARRPGTSQWWSAHPASGHAEFPALFTTAWDLEVERPGVPVAVRRIDVPEGTEALVIRWAPAE